jgi:hypothetical protein
MRRFVAIVVSLGMALLFAVPAIGFGPSADTSSSTTDPAVIACAGPGTLTPAASCQARPMVAFRRAEARNQLLRPGQLRPLVADAR